MTFAEPRMFWLFLLVWAPLVLFLWRSWRKRQELIGQFVQSRLLAHLTVGVWPARQKLRLALVAAAIACLIFALARPQHGFHWEESPQQGLDIVVAFDTSRSMLAEDVRPNRLERAKLAVLDLARHAKGDRLGLVPFAGTAFLQCPLTFDGGAIRQNIEALRAGIIPQGGTDLAAAIRAAAGAFDKESDNHKVLVLFSDGEEHDDEALDAAREAAQAGLRIFTVGVGTAEGDLIPLRDERGAINYLKDNDGNVVKTRLHETLLQQIATAANGFYIPLQGANPIETLYTRGLAPLPKGESSTRMVKMAKERYRWPAGAAIGLLLLEMFLPQRRRVRRSGRTAAMRVAASSQTASLILLLALPVSAIASPSRALREYRAENYESALQEYQRLLERGKEDPRVHFNAGNAAFRAKQLERAAEHFSEALASPDLSLQQRAYYNLGNSLFHMGEPLPDPGAKVQAWKQAAQSFENALRLDPEDTDARHNLELVRRHIEELRENPPPAQNGRDEDDGDDDSQEESQQEPSNEPQAGDESEDQQQDAQQPQTGEDEDEEAGPSAAEQEPQPAAEDEAQELEAGQMTPDQALQLLDSLRDEERPLIFQPPRQQITPPVRDW